MGKSSKQTKGVSATTIEKDAIVSNEASAPLVSKDLAAEHLPPIGLIFTVIICSGFLFMFAFRDVFATGRNIGGSMDEAMLVGSKLKLKLKRNYCT
jgi:hypothetical protein